MKMPYRIYVFIAIELMLVTSLVNANYAHFGQFSTDNSDIANDYITQLIQDSHGYLWLGTMDGLSRYDGYSFKNYVSQPNDHSSLSGNTITSLMEDSRGDIWVGTEYSGLNRFDRKEQRFYQYRKSNNNEGLQSNYISAITEDRDGNIWLGTDSGFHRLSRETNTIINYTYKISEASGNQFHRNYITSLLSDENGIWIGTGNGLYYFSLVNDQVHAFNHSDNYKGALSDSVIMRLMKHDNFIWVLTGNGIDKIDYNNKKIENYGDHLGEFSKYDLRRMVGFEQDIWIGTRHSGLYRLNTESLEFTHYQHYTQFPNSPSSKNIVALAVDKSNILWIGTYLGGLNKLPLQNLQFRWSRHLSDNGNTVSDGEVYDITEDEKGNIWILTDKTLDKYDPTLKKYTHYSGKSFSSNEIINLKFKRFSQSLNYLWIATINDGIKRFDKRNGEIEHYSSLLDHDEGKNISIFRIYYDSKDRLWFSTDLGLFQLNVKNNKLKRFVHDENINSSISATEGINAISEDAMGNIWIGTLKGLDRYKEATESFTHYSHRENDSNSISNNQITNITADIKNPEIIWVGTENGLNRINIKTDDIERFIYNKSRKIYIDKTLQENSGNLWVGTNKGLIFQDVQRKDYLSFYKKNGLQNNTFMDYGALRDSKGFMHFGGPKGITTFSPEKIKTNQKKPNIVLSELRVNEQLFSPTHHSADQQGSSDLQMINKLMLPYKNNNISIDFSVLDLTQPENNQFAFKMTGIYDNWQYRNAFRRTVEFTDLSPNTYQLYYKGSNNRGVWSDEVKQLTIEILPPWWQTWWAYSLYIIVVIALVVFIINYRTSQLLNRASELENTVQERTQEIANQKSLIEKQAQSLEQLLDKKNRIFSNISHEFHTPLTLIIEPLKKVLKLAIGRQKDEITLIQRNAYRLLRMVDQLLDISRIQSISDEELHQKKSPAISINALLDAIVPSFQTLSEKKNISLQLNYEENLYVMMNYDDLEKIIGNLLSNAIKYTLPEGAITISAKKQNQDVILEVRDNGIGIPDGQQEQIFEHFVRVDSDETVNKIQGTGIGLSLVKEIVESNNSSIQVISTLGEGSCFIVTLPIAIPQKADSDSSQAASYRDNLTLEVLNLSTQMQQDLSPEAHEAEQQVPTIKEQEASVLIIDDNPEIRQYLQELFTHNYQCYAAADGNEGITKAKEYIPNIIISDIMMPGDNGYEVCRQLKEDMLTCHIPIILLTALNDRDSRIIALEEKVDDYLTKPFDSEELLLRVRNLLAIRELINQRYLSYLNKNSGESDNYINEKDKIFIDKFHLLLEDNYRDESLCLKLMANKLHMTERQIQRKLKALLGQNPNEYLRVFRINKSLRLLKKGASIEDAAFAVGFGSRNYYATCFKAYLGENPRQYQKKHIECSL